MTTKHTPTPWYAKREGFSTIYIEARIGGSLIQEVAAVGPANEGPEQQEANAAHIVKAVNCHDEMVAALESLLEDYEGRYSPFIESARTILAKAKQ